MASGPADIDTHLAAHGLIARGAFHPTPADGVPADCQGRPAGTLVVVGNAGPAMWRAFSAACEAGAVPDGTLDGWVRAALEPLAGRLGARALFPFDGPPWLPFQRWARRAEAVHPSPLGVLIHPEYGLWHGYRAALAFPGCLDLPPPDDRPSPCESCTAKPCLSACPVEAFTGAGYDVPACAGHIAGPDSADCMPLGCAARRACPVGRGFVYEPAQAGFHMRAFLAAQG